MQPPGFQQTQMHCVLRALPTRRARGWQTPTQVALGQMLLPGANKRVQLHLVRLKVPRVMLRHKQSLDMLPLDLEATAYQF
jgi:hypothetical protein